MASTLSWLEGYDGARLILCLVFDGVDYVATTGTDEDCTNLSTVFSDGGAPYEDWTVFKTGLHIAGTTSQEIQLYDPKVSADSLTFTIVDDVSDTLAGKLLREANSSGNRTYLTASVAAGATSALTVKDTTGFAASGNIYIGHEAISYTTTTATTFGGTIGRAKWTLFQTNGGDNFAPSHLIGTNVTTSAATAPAVTDFPRTWYGRNVTLMVFHEDQLTGQPCSVTEATAIWRGRIKTYRDNGDGSISIECTSVMDMLQRPIGQESWTADLSPTQYIGTTSYGTTNAKLAVSFASSAGTIYFPTANLTAGYYTHQELAEAINAQFETWRSGGTYGAGDTFAINLLDGFGEGSPPKYAITFKANTTTITQSEVAVYMHQHVASMLGFTYDAPATKISGSPVLTLKLHRIGSSNQWQLIAKESPVVYFTMDVFQGATFWLDNANGTFLTSSPLGYNAAAGANGCVQLSTKDSDAVYCVKYQAASGSDPDRITALGKLNLQTGEFEALPKYVPPAGSTAASGAPVRMGDVDTPPRIRQVFYERGPAGKVLLRALLSTAGSSNYNHSDYDVWTPAGRGAAVPASIIDIASWEDLDECETMLLVTEPKPFVEYLEPVLAATNRYVVWRASSSSAQPKIAVVRPELDQVYQQTWALTESSKAGALNGPDRTIVERVPDGLINVVRFRYGMGLDKNAKGSTIEINDVASQSDYGRKRSVTVDCPGISKSSVEKLAGTVASPIIAYLSRPLAIAERTFNASLIRMAPGDSVSLTDNYVMGPRTGTRGSDVIYGWIIGCSFSWDTGIGRVRVVFLPEKNPNYTGSWAPSARVDETATGSGYDSGTKTLTLYQNYYSPSGATADAKRFASGDAVHIYSLDEATPTEWFDTIDGTPTNTTMVLTTGLAGFDTAKRYVVEPDDISTVQNSQRGAAFIASASLSTGYVSNPVPYEWGMSDARDTDVGSITYSKLHPIPSSTSDDQGEPVSVHKIKHVAWGLNSMLSYRRNVLMDGSFNAGATAAQSGTTEKLIWSQWCPLYSGFTPSLLTFVFRSMKVMCRAYVDSGCTGTIKVYTSPTFPVGTPTSFTINGGGSESYCSFSVTNTTADWTSEGSISSPAVIGYKNGVYGTWVSVSIKTDTVAKSIFLSQVVAVEDSL